MWELELDLRQKGVDIIAGVDEAGRGPLAGPVVAAAVILPKDILFKEKIADSKKLTPKMRERAFLEIIEKTIVGVGVVEESVIDEINILQATLMAMQKAILNLKTEPQWVLIDGTIAPQIKAGTSTIINGDNKSISIAAASIVAKVHRDRIMLDYDKQFPGYGFSRHKGYGTKIHLDALEKLGVTPIHRRSFSPVKRLLT